MKNPKSLAIQIAFLLIPILISLLFAALLVSAVGRDPLDVVDALWKGAFKDSRKVGGVVNFWIRAFLVNVSRWHTNSLSIIRLCKYGHNMKIVY